MQFTANGAPAGAPAGEVDWPALKRAIVGGLDVAAEFARLGVAFTRPAPNAKGLRECRAVGRDDETPSAFVNVRTGVYHDSGGEGTSLHLFDFALRFGDLGRWIDVVRHYADRAGVPLGRVHAGRGGKIREATYPYRDAAGAVRYAVFRYRLPNGKKSFTQHPPDGRGGWKAGPGCMDGVEPLPYRLPELMAADPEDPVWVVEGEKDADRLAGLGLVATTNHQGAQSTDRTWPVFRGSFAGREVYVLPDNDPGGRAHARRVAGHLLGVARLVKVVELPGLPPKGDVSDWLDLGHDAEELGRLAFAAPAFDPTAVPAGDGPGADPDRDATVADLRLMQSAEAWAWPLWIPGSALTLVAAEAGTGKTRFCFDLHRRVFHGLPWPDGTPATLPPGSRALWVVADNQWQEMCDVAASFGIPDDLVIVNAPASDPYGGTSLESPEELADFEARIARVRPALVVIDTITNTGDFKAQDASDAKRQYKPLQEIAARLRVPLLCVTHLNVGGKVLGRRAVEKVRVVIQMDCPDPDGQPHRRKLWVSKSKAIRPAPLGVTMGDAGNEYDATPPVAPEGPPPRHAGATTGPPPVKTAECMAWLVARLSPGRERVRSLRQAGEEAGHSPKTLYNARDRLGVVEVEEGSYKFWSLPPDDNPADHPP